LGLAGAARWCYTGDPMATITGAFPVLFLIARPAAGKSEIIDYLKRAVFENEDDVTTTRGKALGDRLQETMGPLWTFFEAFHNNP